MGCFAKAIFASVHVDAMERLKVGGGPIWAMRFILLIIDFKFEINNWGIKILESTHNKRSQLLLEKIFSIFLTGM